jgi:hypothetical protein
MEAKIRNHEGMPEGQGGDEIDLTGMAMMVKVEGRWGLTCLRMRCFWGNHLPLLPLPC